MITRFGLAPRRHGLTVAEFQEHWRERHGPIIGALPGLRRYWQNHAVASPLPWPGFDACSEIDAPDRDALDAVFADERYLTEGRADEERFVDRSAGGQVLTERVLTTGRTGAVRLLTFLRCAPERELGELSGRLRDPSRAEGALGREVFVRVAPSSVVDAVETAWFATVDAATAHLGAAAAERDRRALAGIVTGTERLLARVHVVR